MTTLFNYDPYYDDFEENKNFLRVLFRPGYSVQARELTQLQTIFSNQIEKFGNNIFKNGSPVLGGRVSLDDKANYVILQPQYENQDISVTDFLNQIVITYDPTNITGKEAVGKVIAVDTTSGNPVIVLKYQSGDRFAEGDTLQIQGKNIFATAVATNATGGSYVAYIQEGVYYFKGQFIKVVPQYGIVELFYRLGSTATINKSPSYKIGLEFTEKIVDEIDDNSLLDPAQDAFNYQAPGANRYQIVPALATRTLDSADISSFFEIVRLVDGIRTKEINYPIYSEIETMLARRTFDESGNYTVNPFIITLEEGDSANGFFDVVLDPGKAYINGYEFETIAPSRIQVKRGGEYSSVSDYDLPTNYDSSLILDSVRGTLDITTFPSLDIHSVPHTSINTSTTTTYNSTKIGTLNANMMRYNDATNSSNGTTHTFSVNVFGANTASITGTVPTGSTNTIIQLPAGFSTTAGANAYANMFFRITSGDLSSAGPIPIASSNSTANTVTLSTNLSLIPSAANGNTFSIESSLRNAESLVLSDGTYLSFAGNINTESKDAATGFVNISDPKRNSLIFDVPYEAIKSGTINNMDLYARKSYLNRTTDAGGSITINAGGTDTFAFTGSPGVLTDPLILNNIICFVRSGTASNTRYGIYANTVLSLANNNYTVTAVSPTQFTVNLVVPGVSVDLLITTKVNNAENGSTGSTRGKQFIPLSDDTHLAVPYEMGGLNTLPSSNTTGAVTTFSGGKVFTSVGATNFTDASILNDLRTPGKVVSLQVPDVYQIVSIYDSKSPVANVSTAMIGDSSYNITDSYEFDNGQRKTHYDHATLKLKRGYSAPRGTLFVQYKYLKHISSPATGGSGLFTLESYLQAGSNFSYSQISKFNNSEDKKLVSLRSAFDFRPTRSIGASTLYGALNPEPLETVKTNFDYYLSRIDQVVIKSSKEISIINGQSAISPTVPPVSDKDMLIYTLYIPPYTETVKEIRADFKNHRRFTMQDIQGFDDRIRGLEYYVSLNTLEKDAASTKVLDANGLERSKYGILVDNFTSKDFQATRGDVGTDNRNLIDNGVLQPASLMSTVKLIPRANGTTGSAYIAGSGTKKVMMISYTPTKVIEQPYATKSIAIANAQFANFRGKMKLFPEFTGDVDTGYVSKVVLNSTQGLTTAFNFVNDAFKYISDKTPAWRDDKDSPFAQIADAKWYKTLREAQGKPFEVAIDQRTIGVYQAYNDNTYISKGAELKEKGIASSSSEVTVGSFVTDLAIQPYMKPRQILFINEGLRPKTITYSFFDDTNVDKYIVVPNKVTLNANTQLIASEAILIANTISDLTANLSSLISGNTSYDAAFVVVSETGSANVSIINETGKPLTNKYVYGLDSGKFFRISTVEEHHSGVGKLDFNLFTLEPEASSVNGYYVGKTLTLIRNHKSTLVGPEEGIGYQTVITAYNGTTKVATTSIATIGIMAGIVPTPLRGNPTRVTYTIGDNKTNKLGQAGGVFYMPPATFRSGQRNFRQTESFNNTYDADAISFADKIYTASGITENKTTLVDTVFNIDVSYQVIGTLTSDRLIGSKPAGVKLLYTYNVDPLAQTFYIDEAVYPSGIFLDSMNLFFKAKDGNNIPVTIQIRPTVNGFPSSDFWFPESVITKYPSEINISENPSVTDNTTATNFKFNIPVYLKPGLYAFVVVSDSPEHILWEAEKGGITKNNEYVDKQPYSGTLYKSQNAMEFAPFINEDLMFTLYRCLFSKDLAIHLLQNENTEYYKVDKLRLIETSIIPSNKDISFTRYVQLTTSNGDKETVSRAISPGVTYGFGDDSYYAVGYRRKSIQAQNDLTLRMEMLTTNDAISPIVSLEGSSVNIWENFLDNAEINPEDFTIVSSGSGYTNANSIIITSSTGTGATANVNVDANGNVVGIYVSAVGSGYLDNFSISYPKVGSSSTVTANATIVLNSEYDSSGGPCLARYITKPIALADGYDAGDMRVFLSANKPGVSEVSVYYKMLSASDSTLFVDRPYQKMVCINPTTTPSLDRTYREYEYRPSNSMNSVSYTSSNGVTYDTFKTFSIKIVMTSSDPSVVPTVRDLRVIATPAG